MTARCRALAMWAAVSGCVCTQIAAEELPVDSDAFTDNVRPFLLARCHGCHGKDEPEAAFRVDDLRVTYDGREQINRWLKVFERLKAGEMPPKDEPRPTQPDLDRALRLGVSD